MTATLTDLQLAIMSRLQSAGHGPVDALVTGYDEVTQTVTLQICVAVPELDQETGEITSTPPPTVKAPLRWPSGGGRSLTWGLDVGDRVSVLRRAYSHDEADAGAVAPVTPASTRTDSFADAIAMPGEATRTAPLPASAVRADGQPVLAMPAGESLHLGSSTASRALADAARVASNLSAIKGALDAIATAAGTTNPYAPTAVAAGRIFVDG